MVVHYPARAGRHRCASPGQTRAAGRERTLDSGSSHPPLPSAARPVTVIIATAKRKRASPAIANSLQPLFGVGCSFFGVGEVTVDTGSGDLQCRGDPGRGLTFGAPGLRGGELVGVHDGGRPPVRP